MKKNSHNQISLFITLFTLGLLSALFSQGDGMTVSAGITDVVKDIHNLIKGWNTFFNRIAAITSVVGFKTIILFLTVLMISSGLSTIGVPRGTFSFFTALLISDSLWFIFKSSFNPETYDYLWPIIRSNLAICIPILLLYGGRFAFKKIKIYLKFRGKEETLKEAPEELLARSLELYLTLKENPSQKRVADQSEELTRLLDKLR